MSEPRYIDTFYTTVTVYKHQFLLHNHKNKSVILDQFRWLVENNKCAIFAFVIMSNHFHVIWQMMGENKLNRIRHSLLSFTAKELLKNLSVNERASYLVDKADLKHQIFERNPLSVELFYHNLLMQKMHYIHDNPKRAGLVEENEGYYYSSYKSYLSEQSDFDFLTFI